MTYYNLQETNNKSAVRLIVMLTGVGFSAYMMAKFTRKLHDEIDLYFKS